MKKIIFALLALMINSILFAQNAPQWRGPNRDGIYNETGLLKQWPESGPKLLWHFDELGEGFSTATVAKDYVFTTGMIDSTGYLFALNHKGELQWKKSYGLEWDTKYPGTRSTPVLSDGNLYLISGRGDLLCIKPTDGSTVWKINVFEKWGGKQSPFGITENLLIMNDTLICTVGGSETNVVALNKKDGTLIWESAGAGKPSSYGSPSAFIINGKKYIAIMTAGAQICVDASNGKLMWQRKHTSKYKNYANTPIYKDGLLFQSNMYANVLEVIENGNSFKEVWVDSTYDNYMSGYVIKDNYIYGSAGKKIGWTCVDFKTGKTLYKSKAFGHGAIIMADDMLYCYSEQGKVALVEPSPEGFKLVSKFDVPYGSNQNWAHPVIVDKKMYIRHGNSLMAYSLEQ